MQNDIASLRVEYDGPGFTASAAGSDPMRLFASWFADAQRSSAVGEPNAMALATSTADGVPSVRMVLLKAFDVERASFTWFTNLESRKAREIFSASPGHAALAWWWPGDADVPGRQVRAVGRVELLDRGAVRDYFASRPRGAQVGAAASQQSKSVRSRADLELQVRAVSGHDVAVPDSWGGITLLADELEFWQGRTERLHDRIVFRRAAPGAALPEFATLVTDDAGTEWHRIRLQP